MTQLFPGDEVALVEAYGVYPAGAQGVVHSVEAGVDNLHRPTPLVKVRMYDEPATKIAAFEHRWRRA